ncbi:hypothetical protein K2173_003507 [Erythroxylum novogranatense]|uniref:non-specific serine/threonine protein kinase n=1 Tax=Erythroxylum novogranatense TaxID=1862640 RepID=A0AAV8TC39_9ROSI|nr:hypothetical protein K2173_003507 [Erythroxylum novogranatense]
MACLPRFLKFNSSRERVDRKEVVYGDLEIMRREEGKDCYKGCVDDDDDFSARRYRWDEIERMTLNFSRTIGCGGFSTVYLAHLPSSTFGAIKVHSSGDYLSRVFKQELNILRRLDHQTIVKLLGYSDDREEGALVFEYVPNGSLQDKLHGQATESRKGVLSWKRRMAIAFQLAQALDYLHEKCDLQIVHGDIKPSNILLDEKLNCKLCDFGLAKMGFSSMIMPSSRTKQVMMGSPGYTDPQYLRTGISSKKNDVYSYGVIVLELVTGMKAFCEDRGQLLTSIMAPLLRDVEKCEAIRVSEVVDPRLKGEVDLGEAKTMLHISALCLGHQGTLRPSATNIVHTIQHQVSSISFLFSSKKAKY